MNIEEDYVSFEVAKLLKEKGFNIPVRYEYHFVHNINQRPQFHRHLRNFNGDEYSGLHSKWYSAPTIQTACKWLRESHNVHIWVQPNSSKEGLYDAHVKERWWNHIWAGIGYKSYEKAVETAFKYVLENLI